jgi:hypothetical protein
MRPILPVAAAVLLAAGAVSIPALTQAAQAPVKHHVWKKANIDTAALSASMSAQNPTASTPPAANVSDPNGPPVTVGDQQPGAIGSATPSDANGGGAAMDTSGDKAPAASGGMSKDNTMAAPGGQSTDSSMQPTSGKDTTSATAAKHSKMKHGKKTSSTPDTSTPNATAPADANAPGAITSGSTNTSTDQGMMGNSATTGANASPSASPDDSSVTAPDASKATTTPSATSGSSSSQ